GVTDQPRGRATVRTAAPLPVERPDPRPKGDHAMLKKTIALAVAAGLALTACGDADDDSSSPADPTTVTEAPERIVSLLASGTEILFAIGAGDQVVAADSYSN